MEPAYTLQLLKSTSQRFWLKENGHDSVRLPKKAKMSQSHDQ
jgi:hypothetical protein